MRVIRQEVGLLTLRSERVMPGLGDIPGLKPAAADRVRCASKTSDPAESCESPTPAACACAAACTLSYSILA